MATESEDLSFTTHSTRDSHRYTGYTSKLEISRWTALVFSGLTIVGLMYADGLPVSLESYIIKIFDIDDAKYNLIYTLGGIPTLFMPIIGGYLTDWLSCRIIMFLGLTVITLGQGVMCLACYNADFNLLIIGKVIEMLAWDTMYISRYKMVCALFYEKHLTLAIGIDTLFITLSGIANQMCTPRIYNHTNSLGKTWFFGFSICVISWISALGFIWFDRRVEQMEEKAKGRVDEHKHNSDDEPVKIADIFNLRKIVWVMCICYALSYGVYNVLLGNINVFLQRKFGFDNQQAGNMTTTYSYAYQTVMLIASYLIDKYGKRVLAIQIATIATFCAIFLFQILPGSTDGSLTPIIPLILLGLFVGIYTVTCFPCLTFLVKPELMGLAFGVSSLTNNILVVGLPYVFGSLVENNRVNENYSYTPAMTFLLIISGVSVGLAYLVKYLDVKMQSPLDQMKPEDALKILDNNKVKYKEESSLVFYGGLESEKCYAL